jgi:hypothetical protein
MQIVDTEPVFCGECGLELIVSQELPSLGFCGCGIPYAPSDLTQKFLPKCGRPIEIAEEVRQQYQRACTVKKVFSGIASAVKFGYIHIPQ